ncbi:hypothetical protein DFQ29_007710 [Apophysomyces sp. BC1021]|nr:hypothetical protein DFQ29_007710 [Apophysomyces sp. BC1021]
MFTAYEYLTRPQLQLISILSVPSLTRKFIQVSHESLAEIMRHFGLGQCALSITAAASNTIHQNFKIFDMKKIKRGAVEYYCLAGFPKTNTKIREWKDLYGIPQLESSFGLPKTSSLQGIVNHIQTKNHVSDRLLAFYGTDVQPLKLLNYRGRQKANDEMVKIFKNGGKRYGPHRDHGSDLEVFERQRKADGTLRWRRRQRNQTETPPPSV